MGRYRIDPAQSTLLAEARSSVHPIQAQSGHLAGWVNAEVVDGSVDTGQPASATIELSTDSIHADSAMVDREIQKWLDAQRYPTVVAEINKVTGPAGDHYELHGDLALRHVTRPISGRASLVTGDDSRVEIVGELALDVRDFQLDPPKLLGMRVYPEVTVTVRIVATKAPMSMTPRS